MGMDERGSLGLLCDGLHHRQSSNSHQNQRAFEKAGSLLPGKGMPLLDAIASVILLGMMLVPLVNIIVGIIVGAGLAGPFGGICGAFIALAITGAQRAIGERRGSGS